MGRPWTTFAANPPSLRVRLPYHPLSKKKTASSWPTRAAAFIGRSPSLGPTAQHPYEHQHQQRPRPACDGRATCNPSAARCFLPRIQQSTQHQQRQKPQATAAPALATMVHSADYRADCAAGAHRTTRGGGGVVGGSRHGRRRAPTPLSMTGPGEEAGGAAAAPGPKPTDSAAKAKSGLRLFNTEGRTKQLFRPQDRRQVLGAAQQRTCLRASPTGPGWAGRPRVVVACGMQSYFAHGGGDRLCFFNRSGISPLLDTHVVRSLGFRVDTSRSERGRRTQWDREWRRREGGDIAPRRLMSCLAEGDSWHCFAVLRRRNPAGYFKRSCCWPPTSTERKTLPTKLAKVTRPPTNHQHSRATAVRFRNRLGFHVTRRPAFRQQF